ncbi:tetratricopeptide repeat protein [Yinghuangia soli]|uniref:Tetratricopeptide repeat protein n=1 Tax=Yinghuangia soli TaxID=2908204 RepID=A0AA41Q9I7_9ACTN|nr:tetratricopeptide repeat protein [Yinghuangia soli]MCF2533767.1 tetratricopeptide repeat protein [Yinghuangia soli]
MAVDGRLERAKSRYERSVFSGEHSGLDQADRELDALEADLAMSRGRIRHARFLAERDADPVEDPAELPELERALALYRALGQTRGEADALLWIGLVHQVIRRDDATAVPYLEQSRDLAEQADEVETLAEALRHLGIAHHFAGRLQQARDDLTRSSELRRKAGRPAGVASNMIGLGYIAAAEGRRDDALQILAEADALARAADAHAIAARIEEARAHIRQAD